ncbi:NifU family protein [Luteibaculum oceani]|uniref:NifU family protein n=1 Tax=Luteibaculum oceani TaxID=1294296 RepID=A0A5C6V095_9FLAO|nr:NifU family protein [Luteibaculum oceani]
MNNAGMVSIEDKINEALNSIRPFLEADGGDVTLEEVTDDGIAKVKLHGACSSCSMSSMTMKAGIEEAIKKAVPQINAVIAVNNIVESSLN